jgi:hypothetical protein
LSPSPKVPTEPFLLGNQWIDPDFHIPVGFDGPTELGVFWLTRGGVRYYWLTPEERHQHWLEQEASHHVGACARRPVAKLLHLLPDKFLTDLTEKATRPCCKRPVEHDIEAFYVSEADAKTASPDLIYVLHCKCGRKHRRHCVGSGSRPFWTIR